MKPRSGRTLLIVLIAVLVVVALPVIWIWSRPATQPAPDAGQAVAEAFLREIREGRPEAAWESTTAEFKSARGRESFVRDLKGVAYLGRPLDFVSTQSVVVQDQPRSEFLYRSPEGQQGRLVLGREGADWKVDRWTRK